MSKHRHPPTKKTEKEEDTTKGLPPYVRTAKERSVSYVGVFIVAAIIVAAMLATGSDKIWPDTSSRPSVSCDSPK